MKPSKIEIERMAVRFRANPQNSPALGYADVWDFFSRMGGDAAIHYGMLRGTPPRFSWKRWDIKERITSLLEQEASK